ncbi:MAG: hypothetical protein FWG71_08880 [Synergistaceae bacterium]|nr:hypothetical protein [Synergistaceae bacterium]
MSIKRCCSVAVIVLMVFFSLCCGAFAVSDAPFDAQSHIVDEGMLFTLDDEGEWAEVKGAKVEEEDIQGEKIYWLAVNPGAHEIYKGWQGGIYFFDDDGEFISMVEKEDAERTFVQFSPDGEQFILSSGTYVDREYLLYDLGSPRLKKTFYGIGLAWLDSNRFAFTLIDTPKGARYEGADFSGWLPVVVYNSAADSLTTVVEATKTEDFLMERIDGGTRELVITKFSVADEKDWAEENRKIEEIRVPAP